MALSITLGGVDRTSSVRFESLVVTNTIASNADTAELKVVVQPGSTWRPLAGNEIIIDNGGTREFGGIVMRVVEQGLPGPQLKYVLQCRDYLHLFNKKLVVEDSTTLAGSSAPTADQVVVGIVSLSTDGFSSTGVAVAPSVATQQFDYVPPGDVVRDLADSVNYAWWIDYNKVVNFVSAVSMAAPVPTINLDTDITNYGAMEIVEGVESLKNKVYVRDWKQKSDVTFTQTYLGDGVTRLYPFQYEPSALADITATLNGVALSVLTDQVDGSPGDSIGTSSSIFVSFDHAAFRQNYAAAIGETLVITSNYMLPGITAVEETDAQSTAAAREGGDGIHEYAYADPRMTASNGDVFLAIAKGNTLISRDAYARISGKFVSYTQGWRAGQSFTLNSTTRMLGSLPRTVYAQQVTKKLVGSTGGTPTLFYQVEFSDGALAQ